MNPKDRTTAGLIAVILGLFGFGWLGIHEFVMGNSRNGWTRIIISVGTCFIGATVLTVVSIIEGIIYLTMSDETWYQTYIVGKKSWF